MRVAVWTLAIVLLLPARFDAQASVAGEWQWKGPSGWQEATLHLTSSGGRIAGRFEMGPDSEGIRTPDAYWRYFFEPAVFPISNLIIQGNRISFEQLVPGPGLTSAVTNTPRAPSGGFRYNGKIEEGRMILTREWTARPQAPFELGSHKVEFTMVRAGARDSIPVSKNPEKTASRDPVRAGTVSLDVEVRNPAGQAVTDLHLDDFLLFENGEPRVIQSFDDPGASRSYLLLYDHNLTWLENSAQLYPANHVINGWNTLLGASAQFIGRLRSRDLVSIGTFEDRMPLTAQWRNVAGSTLPPVMLDVAKIPGGQKDFYGVISWALGQFGTLQGVKNVIVFTDGRDGRFSPRWLRDPNNREVLDPFFGLDDVGEVQEFESLLGAVAARDVRFYFIAINTDQDPEFGPAVVRRRISGLFPGAREAIDDYLTRIRSRMESLAKVSGGRVLYGETPSDAVSLFRNLDKTLGVGTTYHLKFVPAQSEERADSRITVRIRDRDDLRVSHFRTGDISR